MLSSGPLYSISETPSKDKLGELVNVHEGSGACATLPRQCRIRWVPASSNSL